MHPLLFLFVSCALPAFGQACRHANFEPPQLTPGALKDEFRNAVVRLQVGGEADSGTGYLIDSSRGYIVTAFHVVAAATSTKPIAVQIPSSQFATADLLADVVRLLDRYNPMGQSAASTLRS